MTSNAGSRMKLRLRDDLKVAMKLRELERITIIRDLIAALDNAEATPVQPESAALMQHDFHARSAEIDRLALDDAAVAAVISREIATREHAAGEFDRMNQPARAEALREEMRVAQTYLGA